MAAGSCVHMNIHTQKQQSWTSSALPLFRFPFLKQKAKFFLSERRVMIHLSINYTTVDLISLSHFFVIVQNDIGDFSGDSNIIRFYLLLKAIKINWNMIS